jgi:hypothetical protein
MPSLPGHGEVDRGLFDFPAPKPEAKVEASPAPAPLLDVPAPIEEPKARPRIPPPVLGGKAASGASLALSSERTEARQGSLIVNLMLAVALLGVLAAVGRPYFGERVKVPVNAQDAASVEVSNGLYETRSGRPVLFVRGEVENRGGREGRLKVKAELWEGGQRVRTLEGLAGAVLGPEELYGLTAPAEIEAQQKHLNQGARKVAPGARAPFFLVAEAPLDTTGLKVKVQASLEPAGGLGGRSE